MIVVALLTGVAIGYVLKDGSVWELAETVRDLRGELATTRRELAAPREGGPTWARPLGIPIRPRDHTPVTPRTYRRSWIVRVVTAGPLDRQPWRHPGLPLWPGWPTNTGAPT